MYRGAVHVGVGVRAGDVEVNISYSITPYVIFIIRAQYTLVQLTLTWT